MKIICVGRNYVEHAKELNNPVLSEPLIFMKPTSAILANNKPFYFPEFSNEVHYEVELVLKICKNGRHVQPEFASDYYTEIGLGIDFTARDVQAKCKAKGHPWEIAKGFDDSAVLSSFIPIKTLDNPITFSLFKNGKKVQSGNTHDMIFTFEDIICYASKFFRLQMGDYIYTGTPAGVGPIEIGDLLEGFIGEKKMFYCKIK